MSRIRATSSDEIVFRSTDSSDTRAQKLELLRNDMAGVRTGLVDVGSLPLSLSWGARAGVHDLYTAELNVELLYQKIVGYGAVANTSGGTGLPFYHCSVPSWNPNVPHTVGWGLEMMRQNGGNVIIDTRGHCSMLVTDEQQMRFDVGENNGTIYAPNRNVTFWYDPLAAQCIIKNKNFIMQGISHRTFPGPKSGDYAGTAAKIEEILCYVFPTVADQIAILDCGFRGASDGALDIGATTLDGSVGQLCRMSIQGTQIWEVDEASLWGAIEVNPTNLTALNDARSLLITLYRSAYLYCGQRPPKLTGRAFCDMVDSLVELVPFKRDAFGGAVNPIGACNGPTVQGGGWLNMRGVLVSALYGSGYAPSHLVQSPNTGVTGALKVTDCDAENCAAFETANEGTIPALPYDLPHTAVPAVGPERETWRANLLAQTGPYKDAAPPGVFVKKVDTAYPNGDDVLAVRGDPNSRLIRTDLQPEYAAPPEPTDGIVTAESRGYTRTVGFVQGKTTLAAIHPNALDVSAPDSGFYTVVGNGGPVQLKFVQTTDGSVIQDGQEFTWATSSSALVTPIPASVIAALCDPATDQMAIVAHGMNTGTFPVTFTATVFPGCTVAGQQFFAIKVDNDHIRLALTYDDAINGVYVDLTSAGTAVSAIIGSFVLPGNRNAPLSDERSTLFRMYTAKSGRFIPQGFEDTDAGTYTPTLTAVANCSALAVLKAQFQRNKNIVNFSLLVTGTQTAGTTLTKVDFTLGVASNLAIAGDLLGQCVTSSIAPVSGGCTGDAANDRGEAQWVCSATAGAGFALIITGQYEVK